MRLGVLDVGSDTVLLRKRTQLPGVSQDRARQLLAGAMVAPAAMDLLDVRELEISPWTLREGIILQRLDALRAT